MPLNIDWQQILLHLFNFVILFAVLYFLLYQPVKQFMDKRIAYYKKLDEEAKQNLTYSEKTKNEYENKLASVAEEITLEKERARQEIEELKATKIQQSEKEAGKILTDARQSIEKERAKMLREAQNEISEMVANATEKLIVDSSTSDIYDQFLDTVKRGEGNE